uniref:Leucine-rich repeat-containing protein 15-like n=1 Tax=Diabrotica virgifera virgifera TaxID=50390 RepID=A0A6P7FA04_DIAVI
MFLNKFVFAVLFALINKSFSECVKNYTEIDCEDVSQISQQVFNEITNGLQGITWITIGNDFQAVTVAKDSFSKGKNLKVVMLYQTNTYKLESGTFRDLPKLRSLYLSYNQITDLQRRTFSHLPKLTDILLNYNKLKFIRPGVFVDLPVLRSLHLGNNLLSKIDDGVLTNFPFLSKLPLNNNNIETIFFHKIVTFPQEIEVQWLQNNSLTIVSNFMLEGMIELRELNLGFNKISTIEAGSFAQTPKLQKLILNNNNLKEFDGSAFPIRGLHFIDEIFIDHNYLMFLRSSFFIRLAGLKRITLVGNPWFCNCMEDIYRVIFENNIQEKGQGDYGKGKKPYCVAADGGLHTVCHYTYNETLKEKVFT